MSLGKVNWLLPTGVIGISPLMSVGPVDIGPGNAERSQISVPELRVGLDCVRSAFQRQMVLKVYCNDTELRVVQADNFSWFGKPLDTTPSSSNFVPGLKQPALHEASDLNAGSILGAEIDGKMFKTVAQIAEKLSKRGMSERKMSQYLCSTSSQSLTPPSENGRVLVASLSTDLSNENKKKPRGESKVIKRNSKTGKRMQLSNTPKETSHGVVMKHTIKERTRGEVLKPKRTTEVRRKKEVQSLDESLNPSPVLKEDKTVDSTPSKAPVDPSDEKEAQPMDTSPKQEIREEKNQVDPPPSKPVEAKAEEEKGVVEEKEVSIDEVKSWVTALWHQIRKDIKLPTVRHMILTYFLNFQFDGDLSQTYVLILCLR